MTDIIKVIYQRKTYFSKDFPLQVIEVNRAMKVFDNIFEPLLQEIKAEGGIIEVDMDKTAIPKAVIRYTYQ